MGTILSFTFTEDGSNFKNGDYAGFSSLKVGSVNISPANMANYFAIEQGTYGFAPVSFVDLNAETADTATKLATARTISLTGDISGDTSFDGSANASITATLANSGVTAGSYGQSSNKSPGYSGTFTVPYVTVDAKGRVTALSNKTVTLPAAPTVTTITGNAGSATKLATARKISLTGDVSGDTSFDGSANASITATLANSGVTAGNYGPSANASPAHGGTFTVPYVTVDAKGRVTALSNKTITLPTASTVSLANTINTSTTTAATPNAVKTYVDNLIQSSIQAAILDSWEASY